MYWQDAFVLFIILFLIYVAIILSCFHRARLASCFHGELQVTSMAVTAWTNLHAEGGDYDDDVDDDDDDDHDDDDDEDGSDDDDDIGIKNRYRPHW